MKYLKTYYEFINEAFDLNSFYTKEKIPQFIQETSDKNIDQWVSGVDLPNDVDVDKLKLWYARNLKKYCIKDIADVYDKAYKNDMQENINIFFNFLNYLKGEKYTNDEQITMLSKDLIKAFQQKSGPLIQHIQDYLFSNTRNTQIWKINYMTSFREMYDTSVEWHENLKASGNIINENGKKLIEYPQDFYWIDLQTKSCKEEADAMGHCGRSTSDTLVSLRQKKKDGSIEPFVTMAIDYDDENTPTFGNISQCKGKNNKKPVEKYHKYIADFILKYDIEYDLTDKTDFALGDVKDEILLNKIFDEKPNLFNPNNIIFYKNEFLANKIIEKSEYYNNIKTISNNYYLLEKGFINYADICKKFPNVFTFKNGKFYLSFKGDELSDLNFLYSDNDGNRDHDSSREIVKNINDYYNNLDIVTFENLYMGYLTDKSIEMIENKIEETKLTLSEEEQKEFDEYDDWEEQLRNIRSLGDIKNAVEFAYTNAQEEANEYEIYKSVSKPLLDFFGMKKLIYDGDYILIDINKNWLIKYDEYVELRYYSHNINLVQSILDNVLCEHESQDETIDATYLEIDVPYNDWDGSINKTDLEERISDRLAEI